MYLNISLKSSMKNSIFLRIQNLIERASFEKRPNEKLGRYVACLVNQMLFIDYVMTSKLLYGLYGDIR